MRSAKWIAAVSVIVLAAPGCGPTVVAGAHFASDLEGSAQTFSWNEVADRVEGDSRLDENRFFEAKLHEAIEWNLALRGIHQTDSSPTLLVHHHLTLADHEYVDEVLDDAGETRLETGIYEAGTVVVHLVDARTRETVWVGWSQADIEPAFDSPDQMQRWVYRVVDRMFRRWELPERTD